MRKPIHIPRKAIRDRAMIVLITRWRDLHRHYHTVIAKRVNWASYKASEREKRRRRRKWKVIARVLTIEATLLRWLAEYTQHPDLWSSPELVDPDNLEAGKSRRARLIRRYEDSHRNARNIRGGNATVRAASRRHRMKLVADIRDLERTWLIALLQAIHTKAGAPKPIRMHPAELRPRKVRAAMKSMLEDED